MTNQPATPTQIPEFNRKFTRVQPNGPRVFNVNGPKADAIITMLIAGTFTTSEITAATGASASRVSECRWGLEAAGIAYAVAKKSTQPAFVPVPLVIAVLANAV